MTTKQLEEKIKNLEERLKKIESERIVLVPYQPTTPPNLPNGTFPNPNIAPYNPHHNFPYVTWCTT